MKQIFSCIGMMALFIFLTMSDFDMNETPRPQADWDASQAEPCLQFEIPQYLVDYPTDLNCAQAARAMKAAIDIHVIDCLEITNENWQAQRTLSRNEIEYLVALNGAPETRSLEELPCEDCPFDKLERCPKCVEIHEEAYQQMAGED
jgi:hypothetical protein